LGKLPKIVEGLANALEPINPWVFDGVGAMISKKNRKKVKTVLSMVDPS
jgi:hypothetical protein